ncbi:MAG: alpha/beta hydrolase [Planctomycetaceae bacterium]
MRFQLVVILCLTVVSTAIGQDDKKEVRYERGPDSKRQEGVPKGKITEHEWNESKVFPGTKRRYSVYVPAQYDGSEPAALMVFQDGHAYASESADFRVPIVFDNLIHKGDIPVTIGVFIDPGTKGELPKKRGWRPRPTNRANEYDTLSPAYANLLLQEILPEVEKSYKLSRNPKMRAIGGISSGGICAFTVAWERPDQFHKVLSHVGSFTNIRGGHVYPALIRKHPDVKPIRVFLQDGSNDLDNQHGNWWLSNLQMEKALAFRDYDFKFVGGEGGHNGNHGGAILPDSLRWLWRDWKEAAK